jgi:hypothetical protein
MAGIVPGVTAESLRSPESRARLTEAAMAAIAADAEWARTHRCGPGWTRPPCEQVRRLIAAEWERAEAMLAAERERIASLAASLGATYEEREPCSCGGKQCRGVLVNGHASFADRVRKEGAS